MPATQTSERCLPTARQIARRREQISANWTSHQRRQRAMQATVAMKTLWSLIARPIYD
jgi:hypothetical protein